MAISDKLTYLNTTKTLIREGLNNLGASLTSNDTFRSYVNVLNDLYDYLPKVTGSGANVTLNDTKKGLMKITLDPSELLQSSTPSPSSPQDIHTISGSNTIQIKDSNNITQQEADIDLDTIEYCKIGNYEDEFINVRTNNKLPSGYTEVDYIKSDGNSYIDTNISLDTNFKIDIDFIYKQAVNYEQPIISTWNSSNNYWNFFINSGGTADLYVKGHNYATTGSLLDLKSKATITRNNDNWSWAVNSFSSTFSNSTLTTNSNTVKILKRGDGQNSSYVCAGIVKIWKNDKLERYMIPCYRNSDNVIGMYDLVNNQFYVNAGSGTFTTGIETNKWYIKKNIGKVVLDGSESGWNNAGGNAPYRITLNEIYSANPDAIPLIFTNYYQPVSWNDTWSNYNYMISSYIKYLAFRNVDISSLEDFKTWLSTHNTIVYYPLLTPTYTKITGTLANQLENVYQKLLSYTGQTNISQVNNDLAFIINSSALQDLS